MSNTKSVEIPEIPQLPDPPTHSNVWVKWAFDYGNRLIAFASRILILLIVTGVIKIPVAEQLVPAPVPQQPQQVIINTPVVPMPMPNTK